MTGGTPRADAIPVNVTLPLANGKWMNTLMNVWTNVGIKRNGRIKRSLCWGGGGDT